MIILTLAIIPPLTYNSITLNALVIILGVFSVIYRAGEHYERAMSKNESSSANLM